MKVKKIILIVIGVLFSVLLIGGFIGVRAFNDFFFKERPVYLTFSTDYTPMHFRWAKQTIEDYTIEKAGMILPAKINGIAHKFYLQFDTGAQNSIIYENALESLKGIGIEFNVFLEDEKKFVEGLSVVLGGSQIDFEMLEIHKNIGEKFSEKDTSNYIWLGSIGSDFISKKITEIDFKNNVIQFYDQRQDWMVMDQDFVPFDFTGGRLMLPCEIDNKKFNMFYDTGCSSFGLMTTKRQYEDYSNPESDEINYELSWGRADRWDTSVKLYQNSTDKAMTMAGSDISLKTVTFVDILGNFQGWVNPFTKIDGWLGNIPFLDHSIIIDAPQQEFVIIKK